MQPSSFVQSAGKASSRLAHTCGHAWRTTDRQTIFFIDEICCIFISCNVSSTYLGYIRSYYTQQAGTLKHTRGKLCLVNIFNSTLLSQVNSSPLTSFSILTNVNLTGHRSDIRRLVVAISLSGSCASFSLTETKKNVHAAFSPTKSIKLTNRKHYHTCNV